MSIIMSLLILLAPANLDLPPDYDIVGAANATETADRVVIPTTLAVDQVPAFDGSIANGSCVGLVPLLSYYSPGWDSWRMARIAYRESRCQPRVANRSGATGLLQIMRSHCPWLAGQMGTWCSQERLRDPEFNVRAAAVLWREQGYSAWATS